MAATTDWSGSPSGPHSPDTASPIFPHRPIRPLPKRRILSRLSEEQADAIEYPPAPPSPLPLFTSSPQSQRERYFLVDPHASKHMASLRDQRIHNHVCSCEGDHSEYESEEDDDDVDSGTHEFTHRYSWPGRTARPSHHYIEQVAVRSRPAPPNSSTSSADGYESFENTNNKKKRKIPISGALGPVVPPDAPTMDIPAKSVDVALVTEEEGVSSQYHGAATLAIPSSSGVGISGAGRGRYGRPSARPPAERRPLATSTNAANTGPSELASTNHDHGIISAAIANAVEEGPLTTPKGQENVSLLQRQKAVPTSPNNFTFECKSNSSNMMGLSSRSGNVASSNSVSTGKSTAVSTHGTQTSPKAANQPNGQTSRNANTVQTPTNPPEPAAQPPRKVKPRRPGQGYLIAAQQRREQKAIENYHHPPRKEDIWICEFCEYESIFGKEPQALIRQYEKKDRRARKASEERRRLLEKAKAKARKNKKSSKGGGKNSATASSHQHQAPRHYDAQYDDHGDSQGEDYFEDDEDDGYDGFPHDIDQEDDGFDYAPPANPRELPYSPKIPDPGIQEA